MSKLDERGRIHIYDANIDEFRLCTNDDVHHMEGHIQILGRFTSAIKKLHLAQLRATFAETNNDYLTVSIFHDLIGHIEKAVNNMPSHPVENKRL